MGQNSTTPRPDDKEDDKYYDKTYPNYLNKSQKVRHLFKWPYIEDIKKVDIIGTFNDWEQPIPLSFSNEAKCFLLMMTLSTGKHLYRFIIDGVERVDNRIPQEKDKHGNINNYIILPDADLPQTNSFHNTIDVSPTKTEVKTSVSPPSSPSPSPTSTSSKKKKKKKFIGSVHQKPKALNELIPLSEFDSQEREFHISRRTPCLLPPHLRFMPLNSSIRVSKVDASIIPVPLHVTVLHLYTTPSNNQLYSNYAITNRYKRKYTTLVVYKPS